MSVRLSAAWFLFFLFPPSAAAHVSCPCKSYLYSNLHTPLAETREFFGMSQNASGRQGGGGAGRGGHRGGGGRGGPGGPPKKESILELAKMMDATVRVKCLGGREIQGILRGYDDLVNLVLDDCEEFLKGKCTSFPLSVAFVWPIVVLTLMTIEHSHVHYASRIALCLKPFSYEINTSFHMNY